MRNTTRPNKLPAVVLTVSTLLIAGAGCATMRPQIEGVSSHIDEISLEGVTLSIDVSVKNKAPISLTAPGGRYGIKLAGTTMITAEDIPASKLPASDVGVIQLPARIRYVDLWKLVADVRDAKEVDFKLDGALPVDVLGQVVELPFEHAGTLPVLRAPKFVVSNIDTSDVSLSGAEVTVTGRIQNPNAFEVGLAGLGYRFALGDVDVGAVDIQTVDRIPSDADGAFTLSCRISSASAVRSLLGGANIADAKLTPTGSIETPYGAVNLSSAGER